MELIVGSFLAATISFFGHLVLVVAERLRHSFSPAEEPERR